jgi:hypothetical protein
MIKGVTGWPSDLTVSARVINRTTGVITVPWTPTGVTETKNGIGYSAYDFNFTPVPGHAYIVGFKDASATPYSQDIIVSENETAIGALALQSYVLNIISSLATISSQLPDPIAWGEDTLPADGTEQNIFFSAWDGAQYSVVYVDLSEMAEDDSVTIRVRKRLGGPNWFLSDTQIYTGVQSVPLILIEGTYDYYGYRVTLQQTSGDYKNFKTLAIYRAKMEA